MAEVGVARAGVAAIAIAALLFAGCGSSGSSAVAGKTSSGAVAEAHTGGARPKLVVVVPNLVGDRFGAAVREVRQAGLHQGTQGFPGSIGNPTFNGHCKKVVSQAPAGGAEAAAREHRVDRLRDLPACHRERPPLRAEALAGPRRPRGLRPAPGRR
jgi:hypothetical protein